MLIWSHPLKALAIWPHFIFINLIGIFKYIFVIIYNITWYVKQPCSVFSTYNNSTIQFIEFQFQSTISKQEKKITRSAFQSFTLIYAQMKNLKTKQAYCLHKQMAKFQLKKT